MPEVLRKLMAAARKFSAIQQAGVWLRRLWIWILVSEEPARLEQRAASLPSTPRMDAKAAAAVVMQDRVVKVSNLLPKVARVARAVLELFPTSPEDR